MDAIAFEKPLALSLSEARQIVELCAGGVKAVVCHQLKHAGHWRRVKQIVEGGGIGKVRCIHATARPSMLRVGTHLVDAMLWLGAESRALAVLGQAHGREAYREDHPCPDHLAGVVELASGARGFLEIGSLAPRNLDDRDFWGDVAVTLWGDEGYARVVLGGGWEAMTRQSHGRVERCLDHPQLRQLARRVRDTRSTGGGQGRGRANRLALGPLSGKSRRV